MAGVYDNSYWANTRQPIKPDVVSTAHSKCIINTHTNPAEYTVPVIQHPMWCILFILPDLLG